MPMTSFMTLHMPSRVFAETMLHARSTCHETRYGEQISWLCDVPVEEPMYFNFYRASVDKDYSPGNKLISGLRDSAVSWAIILPLYYYCENGAAAT